MTIEDKISDLGGVENNPLCKSGPISTKSISELESIIKLELPKSFKAFHSSYGAFSFKKTIKVGCIEKPPFCDEEDLVTIDYFYSADNLSRCSISKLIEKYSNQIPEGYVPICDGESGDLICINLNKERYGAIYYWWHEGNIEEDLFRIDDTFEGFIFKLQIVEDIVTNSEENNIGVNVSPELLKMLKKSGFGPKE